jgi:cytochrome c553
MIAAMNSKRILFGTLLALVATATFAADEAGGAEKKAAVCTACHGPGGGKPIMPEYPVLAGQYANYLQHALHEYKDGKRKNPVMSAQAATLSDEDIKGLAEYFESQPSPLYTPKIPPHLAR